MALFKKKANRQVLVLPVSEISPNPNQPPQEFQPEDQYPGGLGAHRRGAPPPGGKAGGAVHGALPSGGG